MREVILGSTGLKVHKNGFGALPIQRVSKDEAVSILRRAYEGGINFFDTARVYSDSEEKLGEALSDVRKNIVLASKARADNVDNFKANLEKSLKFLKTDYIDIYQFHNPKFCPLPGDGTGLYEAIASAKEQGMIGHIGFTNHRLKLAHQAIDSGLYETLQFPFSYLAEQVDLDLIASAKAHNMGFIGMKGLSGGLITDSAAAYAFAAQFDNLVPIWGIQRMNELEEWLSYNENEPVMDDRIRALIENDKKELAGDFCRGCGYCMPCPVGIEINTVARISLMIRRSPSEKQLTPERQAAVLKIEECLHCYQCAEKCPYSLDTPKLLEKNLKDYKEILAGKPYSSADFRR